MERRFCVGNRGYPGSSLCFLRPRSSVLHRKMPGHIETEKTFSSRSPKTSRDTPIHLFELKMPQNIRPLESDKPTTFFLEPRPYVFSRQKRFGRTQRIYVEHSDPFNPTLLFRLRRLRFHEPYREALRAPGSESDGYVHQRDGRAHQPRQAFWTVFHQDRIGVE